MTFLKVFCLVFLLAFVHNTIAATDKILCYYATWAMTRTGDGKVTPQDIDANLCTHIYYAFMGLNNNGSIEILQPELAIDAGALKGVSALKQKNPKLKALISVGGWELGTPTFIAVSGNAQKRAVFVNSVLNFLKTYNYDGLDIDWEFPIAANADSYIALLKDLKTGFAPRGYLLTAAVSANPQDVPGYKVKDMNAVLDIINVMTYDYFSSWGGKTGQNSPLYASAADKANWQGEFLNCNASIHNWITAGASPEKLAVGIGFYGHSFQLKDPNNHGVGAPASGAAAAGKFTGNQGTLGYNEICEFHKDGTVVFDNTQKVPYLYDRTGLWVGYDNPQSVALKVQYAKSMKLSGVMVWSIETDDVHGVCGVKNGLLSAINTSMKN